MSARCEPNKSHNFVSLRLVHLDKLRLATRREESEVLFDAGGKDPDIIVKAASESKGGVIEKLIKVDEDFSFFTFLKKTLSQTCPECGDEFCYGACIKFQYDCYQASCK